MPRSSLIALVFVGFAMSPGAAWASDLDVRPVRLHLSAANRSAMLTLSNRGAERLRYQVTAEAWRQTPNGEMVLTPTQDLVFFPSLIEIAPGARQRIRVTAPRGVSSSETSYRLTLAPLPDGTPSRPGMIRVLTRFSVPVFVQPRDLHPRPAAAVRVERGRLVVSVSNAGNSYFVSQPIRVVGRTLGGAVIVDETLPGWYVLARGIRIYEIPLPRTVCDALAAVSVTVSTENASADAQADRSAIRCGP